MSREQANYAKTWKSHANSTRLKQNVGWWVEKFTPGLVLLSLIAFATIFYLRSRHIAITPANTWPWVLGVFVLGGVLAYIYAKPRFFGLRESLVRIESRMRMHNRLTSADQGVGAWPKAPARVNDGLAWDWKWVTLPLGVAMVCLVGAFTFPVPKLEKEQKIEPNQPTAWQAMEDSLKTLEEKDVVEPADIEKIRERIEELKMKPYQEWYSHNSMEATDHLKKSLDSAINELAKQMQTASRTLEAFQNYSDQLSDGMKEKLIKDFDTAIKGLEANEMKLNNELMDTLKKMDPEKLKQLAKQLDKEQIDALKKALRQRAAAARKAGKNGQGGEKGEGGKGDGEFQAGEGLGELGMDEEALRRLLDGEGGAAGDRPGQGPGKGGINRGPGTAPVTLSENESQLNTKNLEGVSNGDLERALPGDVLGTGTTEHEIDKTAVGPRAAGAVESTGDGGAAVWKESLVPSERRALKNYFK